ncbi:hypothetical protein [Pseudonocardia sediminis]|uniref:hypothetical protein n=1 Tax=Pseudonocardia sediminis TaxID=1397368 RepID=UPI00102A6E92|nr:hypothetical protein [Pseudonocardia sediminis]
MIALLVFPVVFRLHWLQRLWFVWSSTIVLSLSGLILIIVNRGSGSVIEFAPDLIRQSYLVVFALAVEALVVVWLVFRLKISRTVVLFAIGSLVNSALHPEAWGENAWKYAFAFPASLLFVAMLGRLRREVVLVGGLSLAGLSLALATRNTAGAVAISVISQLLFGRRPVGGRTSSARFLLLGMVLVVAVSVIYDLILSFSLQGVFGPALQRTAELQSLNSAPVAGRVEYGATFSLFWSQPWGFGPGAVPPVEVADIGKVGLQALGVGTSDDYVNNVMFGRTIEVHSILGDLWVQFGVGGIVLGLTLIGTLLVGFRKSIELCALQSRVIVTFLVFQAGWDLLFSPLAVNYRTVGFSFGICLAFIALDSSNANEKLSISDLESDWDSLNSSSLREEK